MYCGTPARPVASPALRGTEGGLAMDDAGTDLVEIMALVKGNVERELLLRNEYLAAERD